MILLAIQALAAVPGSASTANPSPVDEPGVAIPRPDVEAPEDQIVFGRVEDGFPAAVSLGVGGPLPVCSGSLITPRVVLSAAHCSSEFTLEAVALVGTATFGTVRAETELDDFYRFESAAAHPDYVELDVDTLGDTTLGEFDLAVAVLDREAPVDPVPFRIEPLTSEDEGTVVTSVGFGLDETGQGSSGVKRSAELTVSEIDEMFVVSDSVDNPGGGRIWTGGSGGPQYAMEDGRLVQWAVHSWGDIPCRSTSGSTRTDVGAEWILDQVELVHGTRDLCRVNGSYDDGQCDRHCEFPDPDCLPVVFGVGEPFEARTCSTGMNRFCASGLFTFAIVLSRRRRHVV